MIVSGQCVRQPYRKFEIKDEAIEKIKEIKNIKTLDSINLLVSKEKQKATVILGGILNDGSNTIVVTSFPFDAILDL